MQRLIHRAISVFALLSVGAFVQHGAAVTATVSVSVSPTSYTLRVTQTKTFYASVANSSNRTVTWSVNGVTGGNTTVGTVTSAGLYTAPATVPTANVVKIRATSAVAPNPFAEASITLQNPEPGLTSVTPNAVNIGTFTVNLVGRGFTTGSRIMLGDKPVPTTFVSDTALKTTITHIVAHETTIAVANPDPGAKTSNTRSFKIMPPVSLNVTPDTATMRIGTTRTFYGSVSNAVDRTVTWFVNNVKGGNATVGTIDDKGVYTPPVMLPAAQPPTTPLNTAVTVPTVTIKGVSVQEATVSDSSTVTLQNPIPIIATVTPKTATIGTDTTFTLTGTGFVPTSTVILSGSELQILSSSPTTITAKGKAKAAIGGVAAIFIRNPDPGTAMSNGVAITVAPSQQLMTANQAAKFLNRASWGPTPDSIAELQGMTTTAWFNQQLSAPISPLPDPIPDTTSLSPAIRAFYLNAMTGKDQLRQRVAFALGQILVTSAEKTGQSNQMVPYQRILTQGAFGNFFTLLKDVTLSPTMGRFLDMVNNAKADPRRGIEPNENYGRELLQLFSVGIYDLNLDGSQKKDAFNNPIPSYSEETVKQFARALTGWTFPTRPGETPRATNPSYYVGQMLAVEANHDITTKTLMRGQVIPGGRTAMEDLDAVIANIKSHPNVPPFIALRLIQRLTMGNPTGPYVQRVATVFQSSGGDLFATVKAILTDPELDAPAANQGKLKEPILHILSFLRATNATVGMDHNLNSYASNMGQGVWSSPSVFNFFSPFYRINGIVSPEFQITTPTVSLNRVNFIYRAIQNGVGQVTIDTTQLERLASDPPLLVDTLNTGLMQGSMSAAMKDAIVTALNATTDLRLRARNALYLVGSSSQSQVEP